MSPSTGLSKEDPFTPYLTQLSELPFVRNVKLLQRDAVSDSHQFDAVIRVQTDLGACDYLTEVRRSYLDAATTAFVLSLANDVARRNKKLLLLARYIPRPTAQKLFAGGVDFLDRAGNVHLNPHPTCRWTVVGNREQARNQTPTRTAATLQVLFTIAANPDSGAWTVRELAGAAGVGKSKAADARRDLLRDGVIRETNGRLHASDADELTEQLRTGYRQILRPRLVIGTFRPPEHGTEEFLARLRSLSKPDGFRWALCGGPAAYLLQKFYRGTSVSIFVEPGRQGLSRRMRLLPDRDGPVTLLKAFGDWVFWRSVEGVMLAHPWLTYGELTAQADPRSHEAAEEFRREFLKQ